MMESPDSKAPQTATSQDLPNEQARSPGQWASGVTHLVLLFVVAAAAAFVISPGLYSHQVPELKPEALGQPFKSPSPYGFKAGRDYEIVHHALTEQRRAEARASVRPVYDYNPAVVAEIKSSIRDVFAVGAGEGPAVAGPLGEARLRQLGVEEEDMRALMAARYSDDSEQALLTLIDWAYPVSLSPPGAGKPAAVIASMDELALAGNLGITVRVLGEETEFATSPDFKEVTDVAAAKADLERHASLPGNLLPDAGNPLRKAAVRVAKRLIRANLTINTAETELRRVHAAEAVKDAVIRIKKGQKVIGDGELINDTHLVILEGMRRQTDQLDRFGIQLGGMVLVALLISAAFAFHRGAFRRFRPTRKDALLLSLLLLGTLGGLHLWVNVAEAVHDKYSRIPLEAFYYCVPVAAGAMLIRFMLNAEQASFFAVVLGCLAGVMLGNSLGFGIFTIVSSLVGANQMARVRDRLAIFRAGFFTALVSAGLVIAFSLVQGKGISTDVLVTALFVLGGTALIVPMIVMAITPLIEAGFGYASDIKLLELANLNHPALKELIVQAPGTYHHSIIIGSLVEAAAEAIGANALLARSCAYYHDIGKGRNPLYFGENQKGENRHDTLAPAMSAVIIKRHVTEGLEMARQYKLPKRVADAIPQHHGTRMVGFFLHKALKEQEGKDGPAVDESIFRYPGPKPQFRETALVMIADAVEATSRTLAEPTTPKLQNLVQKTVNLIFSEGQLDECELTLRDLNLIAQSFVNTLEGIYHTRPVYPSSSSTPTPKPANLALATTKRSAGG